MESRNGRYITKTVVNTKYGKIVKREDKMFGGFDYLVFHPTNGNCKLITTSFDEAMSKLKELRMELNIIKEAEMFKKEYIAHYETL